MNDPVRRTGSPTFRLIPLENLLEHEEVEPRKVDELVADFRRIGKVADPIWVAVGSGIILNGHHRVAALRRLGAVWVPAYEIDYHSPRIRLERWTVGPPIAKVEVERRASEHRLYPPKTTRHVLEIELAPRPTPLAELMGPAPGSRPGSQPRASRSPRRGADASETT
ncbi:MAG: transcriptional regulator [Thermoplasmata archaeon]|nr:transcriptional regulator [Thermoplasmata archaeon]